MIDWPFVAFVHTIRNLLIQSDFGMLMLARYSHRFYSLLLALLFTFMAVPAGAVEMKNLYRVELLVQTQDTQERAKMTSRGMEEVIVRISGSNRALSNEQIKHALRTPDRFLQQYSYTNELTDNIDNQGGESQILQLQFDATLIDSLLRRARLPIWGANRPNLLLWVTIDDEEGRHIVNTGDQSPLKQRITEQAYRRGLPILFPLMDLEDEASLPVIEAWGLFRDRLESASARYQPEAILAGRLYQSSDGIWIGRWKFIFNGQAHGFSSEAPDLNTYSEQAMDLVADRLSGYYAVNTANNYDTLVKFQVAGVSSLRDYAAVMEYLNKLAAVTDIAVVELLEDQLVFELTTEGTLDKLIEAIALDDKLIPRIESPSPVSGEMPALVYRWQDK